MPPSLDGLGAVDWEAAGGAGSDLGDVPKIIRGLADADPWRRLGSVGQLLSGMERDANAGVLLAALPFLFELALDHTVAERYWPLLVSGKVVWESPPGAHADAARAALADRQARLFGLAGDADRQVVIASGYLLSGLGSEAATALPCFNDAFDKEPTAAGRLALAAVILSLGDRPEDCVNEVRRAAESDTESLGRALTEAFFGWEPGGPEKRTQLVGELVGRALAPG